MLLKTLNTQTVEQEVLAEVKNILIDTGKMKVDISQNPDGSIRVLTMSYGIGDTAVLTMSSGNCFDVSVTGLSTPDTAELDDHRLGHVFSVPGYHPPDTLTPPG